MMKAAPTLPKIVAQAVFKSEMYFSKSVVDDPKALPTLSRMSFASAPNGRHTLPK